MIKIITGSQINLRALNQSDATLLLQWVNNPELKKLIGTVYPISDIEHEHWFKNKIGSSSEKMFGIEVITGEKLIGVIGLKNVDYLNSNAELYVYIGDHSYFGKGLGKDAIKTIIKFAFEEMNLHKVYLEVFSYNTNAKALYEKLGFQVEGISRESIYKQGRYHDKILMGIINNL